MVTAQEARNFTRSKEDLVYSPVWSSLGKEISNAACGGYSKVAFATDVLSDKMIEVLEDKGFIITENAISW